MSSASLASTNTTTAAHSTRNKMAAITSNNSRTSLIRSETSSKPLGIRLFGKCFQFKSQLNKRTYHKALVLLLTFIAYTAFHMGRRPLSIVKNVLNRNCSSPTNHTTSSIVNPPLSSAESAIQSGIIEININSNSTTATTPLETIINSSYSSLDNDNHSCSWAPFDDDATANYLLATLDTAFLLSYAIFMFLSGIVAERMNLRYFISVGTIFSGLGLCAFGLAYPLDIHSMIYFIVIQIVSGVAQTTGWPVVVTCVGNWFGPSKRGLIYGLWNSHTSFGNILGAVLAGAFVEYDWGLSFIVPGVLMILVGIILFLFLVPCPNDVGLSTEIEELESGDNQAVVRKDDSPIPPITSSFDELSRSDLSSRKSCDSVKGLHEEKAVSFWSALKIPGVIEYSMCLFFSKLVSYTFLYWLPRYIKSSTSFDSEDSAYLSTPFDVGGIIGGILAGYFSDKFKASGITCLAMLILAIPSMFVYQAIGSLSSMNNILLQLLVGTLVNGPYCLITTAVSVDLSNQIKDGRAMATVAAIIDGMGSVGAVLGPLMAGFASNSGNWQAVFFMLMAADVLASICLARVTFREIKRKISGI